MTFNLYTFINIYLSGHHGIKPTASNTVAIK